MENKAVKSGIWYIIANFIMKSMALITTPIFGRILTHGEFGLFNNFTSWLNAVCILVTLNLDATFISARYEHEKRFDEYILSTLALSSISGGIWFLAVIIFSGPISSFTNIQTSYLYYMMVYLIFLPAVNMFLARERYYYRYKTSVFVSLAVSVLTAAVSVLLVNVMEDHLDGRIIGYLAPTVAAGVILYVIIALRGKRIDVFFWKYALPISIPYIPHLLSLTLLNSMDRMMITSICGEEDNALYSMAYTCGTIITLLITSMNSAISPWIGEKLFQNQYQEIRKFSKKYILIFVFLAAGLMLITPEVLLLMGGKSYAEAIYVMPPVALGCVCQFLYTMFVNVEQFKKKTIGMAIASMSAALLNYILNAWLIPEYGYIAAAYTTLVSFLWLLAVHMYLVRRMGCAEVYPNKFIVLIVVIMSAFTAGVNFLYQVSVLRYSILGVYLIFLFYFVFKYKSYIIKLIKR